MQIPDEGPHAQFEKDLAEYNINNIVANNIGDGGLLHLSKATWKKITGLGLSYGWENRGNWMRVRGYYHLMRGNWRRLENLIMGNDGTMQTGLI